MGDEYLVEPEDEVAPSMWPENIGDKHQKQFKMENLGKGQDALKDVRFQGKLSFVDFQRPMELATSEKGQYCSTPKGINWVARVGGASGLHSGGGSRGFCSWIWRSSLWIQLI
ncbi:hypothetical protein ABZP36_010725 [Zizania latifolia]